MRCKLFGHTFVRNFASMPTKAICLHCSKKLILNYRTLEWVEVERFDNETRTDKELREKWV